MSPRSRPDWEIIQIGTPPPEAVDAFITALVPLLVRTIHTWIDQGKKPLSSSSSMAPTSSSSPTGAHHDRRTPAAAASLTAPL